MAYRLEFSSSAKKDLRGLHPSDQQRVRDYLDKVLVDPRAHGIAMKGRERFWRYRVGQLRIVVDIDDDYRLLLLVVRIGSRGQVYRG